MYLEKKSKEIWVPIVIVLLWFTSSVILFNVNYVASMEIYLRFSGAILLCSPVSGSGWTQDTDAGFLAEQDGFINTTTGDTPEQSKAWGCENPDALSRLRMGLESAAMKRMKQNSLHSRR